MGETIQLPALAIEQSPGREIFSFSIDGKLLSTIAAISRIRRAEDGVSILGYQRPEVRKHIAEIRAYIDGPDAMVPNAVVVSFDRRVRFVERETLTGVKTGYLEVPVLGDEFVGHVVDGQQRLAAIRESCREYFPIFVVGFIAGSEAEQREQFLRVNSTKPLPRGLIHELLPGVDGRLPSQLRERQLPAKLIQTLNFHATSPLRGAIRTATNPSGRIADTSMIKVISASLSDGFLWSITQKAETDQDEEMFQVLAAYWGAVRRVWHDIWDLPPRDSRLLHGSGVVALGYLMEQIICQTNGASDLDTFAAALRLVAPKCNWTDGWWEFGDGERRRWNEIQNLGRDAALLSGHLVRTFKSSIEVRQRA